MPISSGFSPDPNPNPNYYVRRPGRRDILDEAIYYKREEPIQRPVEIIHRPVIKETIFMPDRRNGPPMVHTRDTYVVAPEPQPTVYTTTESDVPPTGRFSLVPALGLNADCPCWSWICIVFAFILLLGLIGMCLYFVLRREGRI